ncbi:site-specific DNA-methyltransferase [Phenylobacterium sp.]|uniref:site-specific DNA-methyltransferase n=1 Tax=Phenylobacterium sp. TaxID=1871053 RepID=UPI002730031B|nr:site-specific DNA-methyltransferase [Phenylobacterium sp.]MDP1615866.1 site-specific DNA-methyltransferase [Phenylobacterium sp.]MDP1985861.1 site-specific DNA-methyltransferase [Phenylobacterium sp.]
MDKLKMHSTDLSQENIGKIRDLFPGCVTEARDEATGQLRLTVDFDQLRQELSGQIVEGPQERYRLDWPGKRAALALSNAPVAMALRPSEQESVAFESTRNLLVEGDNLEALKLLQETYLGAIKLIYIDPPYNTGNDFVYEDDFAEDAASFLVKSNQAGGAGARLVANPDSSGRFHSDWLDMIYPRVRIARKLLADDGVIVASIDENEISNLRKVFDEVFGKDNLLFQVTLLCNPKGRSQDKYVANCHEYLVGYSKRPMPKGSVNVPKDGDEIAANYKLKDKRGRYRELELRNTHREFGKHNRRNLYYPFYVSDSGEVCLDPGQGRQPVYPDWDDGFEGCWTWGVDKARAQLDEVVAREVKGAWKIFRKNYAEGEDGEATKQVKSIWTDKIFHTEKGQAVFNNLFETREKIFQSPKSVDTVRELLRMGTRKDSVVLDFFAGSGTTGHAVIAQNAEDGGNRKFILVQIAEPTPVGSEALKAGFPTVAEITKERIRRAGKKVLEGECHADWGRDVGFRVLKIDTSNMKDVYYRPDEVGQQDLLHAVDNIKPDRTAEDLLFQVLVDWGVDLTLPITRNSVKGKTVFFVDGNALVACFETGITEDLVKDLAGREPLRVVFRDNGFVSDAVKINVEQVFRQLSPGTDVKSI